MRAVVFIAILNDSLSFKNCDKNNRYLPDFSMSLVDDSFSDYNLHIILSFLQFKVSEVNDCFILGKYIPKFVNL